jgi:hydroxylamine reductase
MGMFCYQCQEAAKGIGCTLSGVCGKNEQVSNLQDLLIYTLKGLSVIAEKGLEHGIEKEEVYKTIIDGLFVTITNANFDDAAIATKIRTTIAVREQLKRELSNIGYLIPGNLFTGVYWLASSDEEFNSKALEVSILATENEDIRSLRELTIYGLKGLAAYAEHASNLGYNDDVANKFMIKALSAVSNDQLGVNDLVALVLETGKFGVDVMALLDKAHTTTYGNPEITQVNIGVRKNPGILISGHDLKDIAELLEQTDGSGVDVYTHSEMLPAHYYPAFKKYKHFVGNYGNAWWQQKDEFATFNGPILFTTNCIVPPLSNATYKDRIYTTGSAGLPESIHIGPRPTGGKKDFSVIIEHAKKCASPKEIETGFITGGFAHNQVTLLADKVVDAVKSGAIGRFFVMAGCDGRMKSRSYYTDFAKQLPSDSVILTAGCAKYRYNKLELGNIGGIPRVLDAGQCNDSYSLAVIALKLKDAFGLDNINDLPVSYNIAWYEQKAVIVLLALLSLGVKNIHLGPTLPAFLSPNVVNVLVDNFGIAGIGSVEDDIKLFLTEKVV